METDYEFDLRVITEVFGDSVTDDPDGYKVEGKVLFYNSVQRKKVFLGTPFKMACLTQEDIEDLKGKCWMNQWEEFHPGTNITHAWKIVDELRKKYGHKTDWCFQMNDVDGVYDCVFAQNLCFMEDPNPAKAISLAGLAAAKHYKLLDK